MAPKFSKYVHEFRGQKSTVLYNSLNNKVLICGKALEDVDKAGHSLLADKGFLANTDKKLLNHIQSTIKGPSVYNALFLLTEDCNFRCKYCYIETPEFIRRAHHSTMDVDTAKLACDLFIKNYDRRREKGIVTFYGGEPLLNKKVFYFIVTYLKNVIKKGKLPDLEFVLVTNGSLITRKDALFLKKNKIRVSVSIDGPEEIHNMMRVSPAGATFDNAMRGYWICKKNGLNPGISCTIGKHNIKVLDAVATYFSDVLKVKNMGFNIPLTNDKNDPSYVNPDLFAPQLIKAFKVLREKGVFEDRMMRSVSAFVEGNIRIRDCDGCGLQVVFHPNGNYGPCQAFLVNDKEVAGNVRNESTQFKNNKVFLKWAQRTPYRIANCLSCYALASCGGGCAYRAYVDSGNINRIDSMICDYSKKVLEWMINESF